MKTAIALLFCMPIGACATQPPPVPKVADCPPLPHLPFGATRAEGRSHWLTVIALYERCAASQQ